MEVWDYQKHSDYYHGMGYRHSIFQRTFEAVLDSKKLSSRKGDIIKFNSGYHKNNFYDWREWFVNQEDKKKFYRRNKKIPFYAMNEYGIVINRYRVVKYKYRTFADYGVIIMMLTGSKPGHIRKYYTTYPYKIISKFPHIKQGGGIHVKMKKPFHITNKIWSIYNFNLSKFITELIKNYGNNEFSRNMFLKQIKELLENNI